MSDHDAFFKMMMTDIRVVKAFLAVHLPKDILRRCDFSQLQANPTEIEAENIIDTQTSSQHADMIYQLSIDGEASYIYVLIEHQSRIDATMRFRLLRYQIGILHAYLKRHPNKKFPIVIPIVFYAGKQNAQHWDFDLESYFEEPALAIDYLFRKTIFVDVTKISDQEILKHNEAGLLELVQKHVMIDDTAGFAKNLSYALQMNSVSDETFNSMIKYILNNKDTEDHENFLQELNQANQKYQEGVMSIAERIRQAGVIQGWHAGIAEGRQAGLMAGIAEGKQAGILEGKLEGKQAGILEGRQAGLMAGIAEGKQAGIRESLCTIAQHMLARQMDRALICELTGLTEVEVDALARGAK